MRANEIVVAMEEEVFEQSHNSSSLLSLQEENRDGGNGSSNNLILKILQDKVEEQNELIILMQTQIDVQTEKLKKQEILIEELSSQVKELQMKELQRGETADKRLEDKVPVNLNNDWTNGTLPQSGSLAEMVKEAAELTLAQSGFVYDENSKLYFDYSSGYYYDPVQKLYYNGHTRTYYSYDEESKQYNFHSQLSPLPSPSKPADDEVQFLKKEKRKKSKISKRNSHKIAIQKPVSIEEIDIIKEVKRSNSKKTTKNTKLSKVEKPVKEIEEIEDGEISSSSSSLSPHNSLIEISDSGSGSENSVREIEPAPCIRAIVIESTVPELRKGFLFLVTCTGGSIGREGSEHAVLLPDEEVSKRHAMINYGIEEPVLIRDDSDSLDGEVKPPNQSKYLIRDLGSQNGTFLNNQRLSDSKVPSTSHEILHGSTLKIGDTILLLHIHPGTRTCGHCEPGLIMLKEPIYGLPQSKAEKEATRKKEMKKLRKKYGIEHPSVNVRPRMLPSYTDRAEERRAIQGSDNPFEKTEVASLDEAIQSDNKGFKMMAKMGWALGKTLGQTEDSGIHEPIPIKFKKGRGGLGSEDTAIGPVEPQPRKSKSSRGSRQISKSQLLNKTRKRFQQCSSLPGPSAEFPEFTID